MQTVQLMCACLLLRLYALVLESGLASHLQPQLLCTATLPTLRAHPGLQGERLSSHMQVPRLKVRRDWFKGLKADPIDHSHPDVGNQPDAETGDMRPEQVARECLSLKLWCLCFSLVGQLAGRRLQGLRVHSGIGTCCGLLGHANS